MCWVSPWSNHFRMKLAACQLACTMDIFLMTCLSVPRSVYGNSGVSQGYLCFVVWTQKSRHIIIWLKSTVYYDYRNLQLKLISLVLIVSLCNGHVYADVIPICRSINVLWIKTISISKVTKYCAALSNAKLNRKWRPLKCIFHNRIRMRFKAFFSFSTFFLILYKMQSQVKLLISVSWHRYGPW